MSKKIKFIKPALDLDSKINLLEKRGLVFYDKEKAKHDIGHIGYFRMTGYFKYYQNKDTNIFVKGTNFEQILDLYIFDRKLRLLTLDAIEKIEVSLKANISDYMSERHGSFWYLDKTFFSLDKKENKEIYKKFLKKIKEIQKKQKAIFVKEYFVKYKDKYLPCWMLFEELTIGSVSTIFNILKSDNCKNISLNYDTYYVDLRKWLNLIVQVRNISAHHSRLWNNNYKVRPRIDDTIFKHKFLLEENGNKKEVISNYYNTSLIINFLLQKINKNLCWVDDLGKLFDEYNSVNKEKMGFLKGGIENLK